MKRSVFRLLAVVAIVGLAASCGGGGGDDDGDGNSGYQFSGNWAGTFKFTESNIPGFPIGLEGPDGLIITQDGNNITVKIASMADELLMTGTCDPAARTFSASGTDVDGARISVAGAGVDDDSMSGTISIEKSGRFARGTWTVNLLSRSVAGKAAGIVRDAAGVFGR